MAASMRIINGKVYDPANNIDGEIKDIYIKDGKIIDSVDDDATTINAKGMHLAVSGNVIDTRIGA